MAEISSTGLIRVKFLRVGWYTVGNVFESILIDSQLSLHFLLLGTSLHEGAIFKNLCRIVGIIMCFFKLKVLVKNAF